ncbi:hypothetical protein F4859DRAFT_512128 [Xylaria cf. heliscus]|nr:hypothetical protein F4859DRAFT_512128 [Xylaria cf. heliscus]
MLGKCREGPKSCFLVASLRRFKLEATWNKGDAVPLATRALSVPIRAGRLLEEIMLFRVDGMVLRLGSRTYSATSVALKACIVLLMIDSIIEVSFVMSTIAWLHHEASARPLRFVANGTKHRLPALPLHLVTGHLLTTNGAAATAFTLVATGGMAALLLRDWAQYRTGKGPKACRYFYYFWLSANMPALLLTGATIIYVFALTNGRAGQKIYVPEAVNLNGRPYDLNNWTPDSWFSAVLQLKLTRDRAEIVRKLIVMKGWLYNLPPMFLFQSTVTVLGYMDYNRWVIKPRMREAF